MDSDVNADDFVAQVYLLTTTLTKNRLQCVENDYPDYLSNDGWLQTLNIDEGGGG